MGSIDHRNEVLVEREELNDLSLVHWFVPFLLGNAVALFLAFLAIFALPGSGGWSGMAVLMAVVLFAPFLFLGTLAVWLVPALKERAGWVGPCLTWLITTIVVALFPGALGVTAQTMIGAVPGLLLVPTLLTVGCWGIGRFLRELRA